MRLISPLIHSLLQSLFVSTSFSHSHQLNFSEIFSEFRDPSIVPFFPHFLRSTHAPLGVNVTSSKWGGLAANQPSDLSRWWKLLVALHAHKKTELVIVFLGGSMTAGEMDSILLLGHGKFSNYNSCREIGGCVPQSFDDCRECAYPAYFEAFLKYIYPWVHITVHNLAVRGCDSGCIQQVRNKELYELQDVVDLVFVNYKKNDFYGPRDYPVVAVKFERLIRRLLSMPSAPAVVDISMIETVDLFPPHVEVTQHYRIPIIAVEEYADREVPDLPIDWDTTQFLDEEFSPYDSWLPLWQTKQMHQQWMYHRILSEFLGKVWHIQQARAVKANRDGKLPKKYVIPCAMRGSSQMDVSLIPCWKPRTEWLSVNSDVEGHYNASGGWILGEDVPGKKRIGWWLDSPAGGEIIFEILLRSETPLVGLLFLQSYDRMGEALVWLDDDKANAVRIKALEPANHVSVSVYRAMCLDKPPASTSALVTFPLCNDSSILVDRESTEDMFTRHLLHIQLLPATNSSTGHNKFKLQSVISC